jgi:hypothetical protein
MIELTNIFRSEWNETFKKFSKSTEERSNMNCPIQEIPEFYVNNTNDLLAIVLTRVFESHFKFFRKSIGIEKYIPKKSVHQLLELVMMTNDKTNLRFPRRNIITWKINKVDVNLINVNDCWFIINHGALDVVLNGNFAGSLEAFKKCIISNSDKIHIC